MSIRYRGASGVDQEKLRELGSASADEELAEYSQKKTDLFDIESYFRTGGCFWIAEDGDKIVGMVGVRFLEDNQAKVKALRVHPDQRGKGVARTLMSTLEDYCREHEIKEIILGVNRNALPAIRLYESIGYNKYDEKKADQEIVVFYYRKIL